MQTIQNHNLWIYFSDSGKIAYLFPGMLSKRRHLNVPKMWLSMIQSDQLLFKQVLTFLLLDPHRVVV